MTDIYIIHGNGSCGKTWFAQNIIYDENVDKYCWSMVSETDFVEKRTGKEFFYKNLIVDDFSPINPGVVTLFKDTIYKHRRNFDNLFIICSGYSSAIREIFCRNISLATAKELGNPIYKNVGVRIHVLDFNNGENFNIRRRSY